MLEGVLWRLAEDELEGAGRCRITEDRLCSSIVGTPVFITMPPGPLAELEGVEVIPGELVVRYPGRGPLFEEWLDLEGLSLLLMEEFAVLRFLSRRFGNFHRFFFFSTTPAELALLFSRLSMSAVADDRRTDVLTLSEVVVEPLLTISRIVWSLSFWILP